MALSKDQRRQLVAADKLSAEIRKEYGGGHRTWLRLWGTMDLHVRIVLMKSPWHKMKGEANVFVIGMFHNDYVDGGMVPLAIVIGFEMALIEYEAWVLRAEANAIPETIAPLAESPLADVMIAVFGKDAMTIRRGESKSTVVDRLVKSVGEPPNTSMGDLLDIE